MEQKKILQIHHHICKHIKIYSEDAVMTGEKWLKNKVSLPIRLVAVADPIFTWLAAAAPPNDRNF